jgi:hypothetical protein
LVDLEPDIGDEPPPARHLGFDAGAQRVGRREGHGHADGGRLLFQRRVLSTFGSSICRRAMIGAGRSRGANSPYQLVMT